MLHPNAVKRKLASGGTAVGTIVQVPHPLIVEACGRAGFDFVILDEEHGALGPDRLADMIRAAEVAHVTPLVRVSENRAPLILQALDQGAGGVVIPGVRSADEARAAVDAAKYAPAGHRGYCSAVRSAGLIGDRAAMERANAETMVILLIEHREAVDAFEAMLDVPGVDVVFIGPGDLSHSLGVPGQLAHPVVQDTVGRLISMAARRGRCAGVHVKRPEDADRYLRLGARFLNYGMDIQVIAQAFIDIVRQVERLGPQ
ncbi:MAG: aldolase/citrate lyase family protein [Armatimonadota bacterium]|nr:aldolase/citrate lyase family protein [Armatimonadota bacterium]